MKVTEDSHRESEIQVEEIRHSQPWFDSWTFRTWKEIYPFLRTLIACAIVVGAYYSWTRETATAQTATISQVERLQSDLKAIQAADREEGRRRDSELEDKMIEKKVFDAYHERDQEEFKEIKAMLAQLIEQQRH